MTDRPFKYHIGDTVIVDGRPGTVVGFQRVAGKADAYFVRQEDALGCCTVDSWYVEGLIQNFGYVSESASVDELAADLISDEV